MGGGPGGHARGAAPRGAALAAVVPSDDRGAPVLPAGVTGSITHKEALAAALVASESPGPRGRRPRARRRALAGHRLARFSRADEIAELAHLDADERAREVLLRFSAKEAVYKALDPFVRRYVGFHEVAVSPRADGTARVTSGLPASEGPFVFEVRWRRFDGIVLTTARVSPAA